MPSNGHLSVLLHEVIDVLAIKPSHTIVDATLGSCGHARAIIEKLGPEGMFVGLDVDREAIAYAKSALTGTTPCTIFVHANFRDIKDVVQAKDITKVDAVLFDLGWRIEQLTGRGLSFQHDEPLTMTLGADLATQLTAREIVNTWDEKRLADTIYQFGEEHFSRHIAAAIVERRKERPIERTRDLAEIIRHAVPMWYRKRRIHPATKTFQALRIAVNDELGALKDGLIGAYELLSSGGRIVVISFHSIEDRIVKQTFRQWEEAGGGTVITKKPLAPTRAEIASNPRARSAKLRVFEHT